MRRGADQPAGAVRRLDGVRHPRRPHARGLPRADPVLHPPRAVPPRTGRRLRRRRMGAGDRSAGRLSRDHRARRDQRADPGRPGLPRLAASPDAVQRRVGRLAWPWIDPRPAGPERLDLCRHRLQPQDPRPSELPEAFADAWEVFESSRPRPVHIEVPVELSLRSRLQRTTRSALRPQASGPIGGSRQPSAVLAGASNPVVLWWRRGGCRR